MRTSNKLAAFFFTSILILISASACTQPSSSATLTPDTNTATPTVKPTRTPAPTKTVTITPNITLTPNITPTHNLAPDATITPPPITACPAVDSNAVLDTSGFDELETIAIEAGIGKRINRNTVAYDELQATFTAVQQNIIDFLNQGGDVSQLITFFAQEEGPEDPRHYTEINVVDVTGDNEPEIFILMALPITFHENYDYPEPDTGSWFIGSGQHTNLVVISCQREQYKRLAWFKGPGDIVLPTILDLNADGIAEIIQPSYSTPRNGGTWLHLEILAWDGEEFTQQISEADWYVTYWYFWEASIRNQQVTVRGGDFEFADIDGNGTIEVVLPSYVFSNCSVETRRGDIILQWAGHDYSGYLLRTPPEFRIHAVRDGDHMTARGYYDEALEFYDRVLNDPTLKTWSPDYVDFNDVKCSSTPHDPTEPVPQNPTLDEQEYDRLAAYTLYRLMLIHTAKGELDLARSYYDRLVGEYTSSVNATYVDLASTFQDAYSLSGNLETACELARSYADEHEESVLVPLGSYYGPHARRYISNDICPFGVVPGA